MAKQPSDAQQGERVTSGTFDELKREIAARNERAHKEAQELRAARERKEFGIVTRHRVDLER
jgi:hypothetical protein